MDVMRINLECPDSNRCSTSKLPDRAVTLVNSGELSAADESALPLAGGDGEIMVMDTSEVALYVVAHASVGKLGVLPTSSSTLSAIPSFSVGVKRDGVRHDIPSAFDQAREPAWSSKKTCG
ncbi:hypothetical protein IFM61606_03104 [Aspergillus udagawae]|nr:hypothetical protein IFM51744_02651 [Aspergillus udagawae]GFG23228.1 hypothetical protein IFM61606_03104 [Aspergillus udagawae]